MIATLVVKAQVSYGGVAHSDRTGRCLTIRGSYLFFRFLSSEANLVEKVVLQWTRQTRRLHKGRRNSESLGGRWGSERKQNLLLACGAMMHDWRGLRGGSQKGERRVGLDDGHCVSGRWR
jgi:hypothetical protein